MQRHRELRPRPGAALPAGELRDLPILAAACALVLLLGLLASPARAASDRILLQISIDVARVEPTGGVITPDGRRFTVSPGEDRLVLRETAAPPEPEPLPEQLPQSRPAEGRQDIALAWLAEPTERYRHGVLGDALEAGALRLRDREGRSLRFALPADAVFEDLRPRLVDLEGDGRDEVILVRSTLDAGAALLVLGIVDGELGEKAATPPIGRPNRWLNPLGAADLDGDGQSELAYVETPHIGGILHIWSWNGGEMIERATLSGVSNHAAGSTALGLHAITDLAGDGLPEIVLPDQSRRVLRVLSFGGGTLAERERIALPGALTSDIAVLPEGLLLATASGHLVLVRR
jgi:hypothetical protein